MIRIDITPVVVNTKVHTYTEKGKEKTRETRVREYSAIARRGEEVLAEYTCIESMSVIPPILKMLVAGGADPAEEVVFYRGSTPVFLPATLDSWVNPPKKKDQSGKGQGDGAANEGSDDDAGGAVANEDV